MPKRSSVKLTVVLNCPQCSGTGAFFNLVSRETKPCTRCLGKRYYGDEIIVQSVTRAALIKTFRGRSQTQCGLCLNGKITVTVPCGKCRATGLSTEARRALGRFTTSHQFASFLDSHLIAHDACIDYLLIIRPKARCPNCKGRREHETTFPCHDCAGSTVGLHRIWVIKSGSRRIKPITLYEYFEKRGWLPREPKEET